MRDLAGGDQLGHRGHGLLHGDGGVGDVLVVAVDAVGPQTPEAGVAGLAHVGGVAAHPGGLAGRVVEGAAELRGQDHLVAAEADERVGDEAFVRA
ncbi:hypothetical protein HNR10_004733 [Nocardiopsis aegyptia]|uniref:Uncharacterized protein n=1 Tax=Nocardiopsis aegyptia TaxID=220378 RepID=A0A7Z0ES22_9ACTN|nr:hypothetical protein [Nocardiopsis aegyptia]